MKRGTGLKVGVIGVGSMGRHYARVLSTLPGSKLAAIADINFSAAQALGQEFGVACFDDYRQMFSGVCAVCIVTPAQTHYPIARDCLEAGKHVLLEKPFTGSTKHAAELIALAKDKNLVLAASFLERFNPAYQRLRKLLKGEKIHGLEIKRFSPFPDRVSDTDVVFDMMIHDLDLLSQIVPDVVENIRAEGEKVRSQFLDRVVATFTHVTGTISRVHANRVFTERERKITVTTEKHLIEADLFNRVVYVRDFSTPSPSTVPVKEANQLADQLKDFSLSVKERRLPAIPGEEALKALALAEEIEKLCS